MSVGTWRVDSSRRPTSRTIASVDPKLGTIFYTLGQAKADRAKFVRATADCLGCHASSRTRRVPGLLVRSVFPDKNGHPVLRGGSFNITHTSPIQNRWGGWYVSGRRIELTHMGNRLVADRNATKVALTQLLGAPGSGKTLYDPTAFLQPTSDVEALMVLEHQALMQNILTEAHYQTLYALHEQAILDRISDTPSKGLSESIQGRIDRAAERVVRTMLFVDEAPLEKELQGHGPFRLAFEARGPSTQDGRTLRRLELSGRLFTLPLSHLVYSETFDQLPAELLGRVYRKLHDVLSGRNTHKDFEHIDTRERAQMLQILRQTKKTIPDYFQPRSP